MMPDELCVGSPRLRDSETVTFQPLTADLVNSAYGLSTQAGWNQTEEDWARLSELDGAYCGVWVDRGGVRASYSLIVYDSQIAWIGMILVDEDYRGAGLGKVTFVRALEHAKDLGITQLGLDATHLGEPIYSKVGFQPICPITRWQGTMTSVKGSGSDREVRLGLTASVLEWDAHTLGVNRSSLLRDFESRNATILRCEHQGRPTGFAVLRPGRTALHLGPVSSDSASDFLELLNHASAYLQGQPVICDVLSPEIESSLLNCGLRPSRHLKRMLFPLSKVGLRGPAVRCAAGFEFG